MNTKYNNVLMIMAACVVVTLIALPTVFAATFPEPLITNDPRGDMPVEEKRQAACYFKRVLPEAEGLDFDNLPENWVQMQFISPITGFGYVFDTVDLINFCNEDDEPRIEDSI